MPSKVEAAYARSGLFERLRFLMDDWSACLYAENHWEKGMQQGELDGVIKARLAFFAAERALVKASTDYEKARAEYERACSQLGLTPHYAPEAPAKV